LSHSRSFNTDNMPRTHDFYNLSMLTNCLPASIIVYKHTYKEMFNDPLQLDVGARRQRPPDHRADQARRVPILFEHTGACRSSACSAEPWSWLVIHKHDIVLCDSNGKYYVAKNIYVLFAYLMSKTDSQ
jgi:hypothetical protein